MKEQKNEGVFILEKILWLKASKMIKEGFVNS